MGKTEQKPKKQIKDKLEEKYSGYERYVKAAYDATHKWSSKTRWFMGVGVSNALCAIVLLVIIICGVATTFHFVLAIICASCAVVLLYSAAGDIIDRWPVSATDEILKARKEAVKTLCGVVADIGELATELDQPYFTPDQLSDMKEQTEKLTNLLKEITVEGDGLDAEDENARAIKIGEATKKSTQPSVSLKKPTLSDPLNLESTEPLQNMLDGFTVIDGDGEHHTGKDFISPVVHH